jgi:septation ring formation regulator EzrA
MTTALTPMMEEAIQGMLSELATLQMAQRATTERVDKLRNQLIPFEVKLELKELDDEYGPRLEGLQGSIDELEAHIKQMALEHGATVKGEDFQVVYSLGRVTWDAKALDGLAMAMPHIRSFRSVGKPSVSIRAIHR